MLDSEFVAFVDKEIMPYVDEWDETLEALKQLDFHVIVPGHGPAFTDRSRIDYVQAFYRDLWTKTEALYQKARRVEV